MHVQCFLVVIGWCILNYQTLIAHMHGYYLTQNIAIWQITSYVKLVTTVELWNNYGHTVFTWLNAAPWLVTTHDQCHNGFCSYGHKQCFLVSSNDHIWIVTSSIFHTKVISLNAMAFSQVNTIHHNSVYISCIHSTRSCSTSCTTAHSYSILCLL